VSLVDTTPSKETLHLSPAVIDCEMLKIYKIGISDIESVTALSARKYTWANLTALSSDDRSLGNLAQSHSSGYSSRPASGTPPATKQLNVSRPASRNSPAGLSRPRSQNQGSRPASRARSHSPQGPVTRIQSANRIRYLSGNSSAAKESPSYAATVSTSRPTSAMGPPPSRDFLSLPPQLSTATNPDFDHKVLDCDPMAYYELVRTPSIYPNLNDMDLSSIQSFEQTQTLPSVPTPPSPQDPICGQKPQLKSVKVPRHCSLHPEVNPPATEDPWGRPLQQKIGPKMKVELT
jgi:hypothetical protein